jgi:hypothetical protein
LSTPEGWPMDADEEIIRTALSRAIAKGLRDLGDASEAPGRRGCRRWRWKRSAAGGGDGIALFALMKAAAALGYAVHLSIIKVEGSGSLSFSIEG